MKSTEKQVFLLGDNCQEVFFAHCQITVLYAIEEFARTCFIALGFGYYIKRGGERMKYICNVCGWVYDEEEGCEELSIAPGTKWKDIEEDFSCPTCGMGKDDFSQI